MPEFTIEVSDAHLERLQQKTLLHNRNNGLTLSVDEFILLTLKDVCILDEVMKFGQDWDGQAPTARAAAIDRKLKELRETL